MRRQAGGSRGGVSHCLALYQKLAHENPAVASFQLNTARSHWYLGFQLAEMGKPAESEYRSSIAILQKLTAESPAVPVYAGELARSSMFLGVQLSQIGRPAQCEKECRAAVAILERLAEDHPSVTGYRGNLAYALTFLGDVERSAGRTADARGDYERAIALREQRLASDSMNLNLVYGLANSIWRRGLTRLALGDPAATAADVRRAMGLYAELMSEQGDELETTCCHILSEWACCHAILGGLGARPGSGVSAANGEQEAAKAMQCLNRAVANGFGNANKLRIESALDPLRDRADFKKLMAELEKNSPPQHEKK